MISTSASKSSSEGLPFRKRFTSPTMGNVLSQSDSVLSVASSADSRASLASTINVSSAHRP